MGQARGRWNLPRSLLVDLKSRYVAYGRARLLGLRLSSLTCPAVLVGGAFLFVEVYARLPKNNPQAAESKRPARRFAISM